MIGKKVEEKGVATLSDVYEILKEHKKGSKPLAYEQQLAFDYSEKFRLQKKQQLDKLQKELSELGLSSYSVAKLIEIMPKSVALTKNILMKENGINDEKISKVVSIINGKGS
jgi:DNA-directed RNA polymerase subunit F